MDFGLNYCDISFVSINSLLIESLDITVGFVHLW